MASKKTSKSKSARQATQADAQILLTLYDQRREERLRKARNYVLFEFAPHGEEDFLKVIQAFGSEEQTYFRMVSSYWEQAAALVTYGSVHEGLFNEFSQELCFLYAKYKDFIPALRKNMNPNALRHVEAVATRTAENRERVARMEKIIAERFRPRAAKTGS